MRFRRGDETKQARGEGEIGKKGVRTDLSEKGESKGAITDYAGICHSTNGMADLETTLTIREEGQEHGTQQPGS